MGQVPSGGAVCLVRPNLGGEAEVVAGSASGLGAELQSVEVLGICGTYMMREQDLVDSRSVSILSMLLCTTSGLPNWKGLSRDPERLRSALMMTNRFSIVFNLIPCRPLKMQQAQIMYFWCYHMGLS